MSYLSQYKAFLLRYRERIKHPGWDEEFTTLVREADALHAKLDAAGKHEVQQFMWKLYEENIRP